VTEQYTEQYKCMLLLEIAQYPASQNTTSTGKKGPN